MVVDFDPRPKLVQAHNVTMFIDTVVFYQITDQSHAYGVENPLIAVRKI